MRLKVGVILQKIGDEFVAYDNETSEFHELSEIAYLILESIELKKDKKEIVDRIINDFEVEKEKADRDYENFLKILENKSLIVAKK